MIIGEHGDSEFALWSQARIGPVPLDHWDAGDGPLARAELDSIAEEVMNAAYTVIAGKGATNYAIGLSGARIVEAVLRDEGAVLPVSSVLEGYHGISGVALSVPSVVDASGVRRVIEVPLADEERERLRTSAAAIRASLEALGID
jgi:L-lactate dehydrogenase